MKLQIFIESEEGAILIDRKYQIDEDGNAPKIDIQDIIDDAKEIKSPSFDDELKVEADRLVAQDKAQS